MSEGESDRSKEMVCDAIAAATLLLIERHIDM
jgi:hypothetical protein